VWTYQVNSKSQRRTYVVTDKAVGEKYVPSLNVTGQVVEEFYNMDRGGTRPIVYVTKDGYWTRLSGLDYAKDDIQAPAWAVRRKGNSCRGLTPDLNWSSKIFPFGHMPGSFDIKQSIAASSRRLMWWFRLAIRGLHEDRNRGAIRGGSYAKVGKPLRLVYEDLLRAQTSD